MDQRQKPTVFARVEPEIKEWVVGRADDRYQGVESMVVRDALVTIKALHDTFGRDAESVIRALISSRAVEVAA